MFLFRKIWRALLSCYLRLRFALLPYCRRNQPTLRPVIAPLILAVVSPKHCLHENFCQKCLNFIYRQNQ